MSQIEKNRSVLDLLRKHGDKLSCMREINHWIYFKSFDDLCDYKFIFEKKGFITQNIYKSENPYESYPFGLILSREDSPDPEIIDDITLELDFTAREYEGKYDGWETPIIME